MYAIRCPAESIPSTKWCAHDKLISGQNLMAMSRLKGKHPWAEASSSMIDEAFACLRQIELNTVALHEPLEALWCGIRRC
jgi:hypothetical protein